MDNVKTVTIETTADGKITHHYEYYNHSEEVKNLKNKLVKQKRIIEVLWQGRKDKQWKSKLTSNSPE